MTKLVLDVGNCAPDHAAITQLLKGSFDCRIVQTHATEDTLAALAQDRYDLVLINRKLDRDYSDGIDVLRAIKSDSATPEVPVMLITNYPEHQDQAVEQGAERGFGKLEFEKPETKEALAKFLA